MINTANTDGGAKLYIKGRKATEDALVKASAQAPNKVGPWRTSFVEADTSRRLMS